MTTDNNETQILWEKLKTKEAVLEISPHPDDSDFDSMITFSEDEAQEAIDKLSNTIMENMFGGVTVQTITIQIREATLYDKQCLAEEEITQ